MNNASGAFGNPFSRVQELCSQSRREQIGQERFFFRIVALPLFTASRREQEQDSQEGRYFHPRDRESRDRRGRRET